MREKGRERIKKIDNLSIKLLPGILGHKPEHGKKWPAKVVKICIAIVRILFSGSACKFFGTVTRYGKQGKRERITFLIAQLPFSPTWYWFFRGPWAHTQKSQVKRVLVEWPSTLLAKPPSLYLNVGAHWLYSNRSISKFVLAVFHWKIKCNDIANN